MQNGTKKKILITGATGFIGKYLVEHAILNNYEVYVALRKTSKTARIDHLNFKKIIVDFSSQDSISQSFPASLIFDTVIHNAGVTSCLYKDDYFKYNTLLTKNLCSVLKKQKLLKGKFIYTSSLAALGPGSNKNFEDITENKPPKPISNYGKSKLLAEKEIISTNLNYAIIRPTAVFGEGTNDYKDLIAIVKKRLAIYTANPQQLLSFIHANDIARAIFLIDKSANKNTIYNLSDTQEYTLASVYNTTAKALNTTIKFKFRIPLFVVFTVARINQFLKSKFEIDNALDSTEKAKEITALNWKCSAKKIQQELNFKPAHSLTEIID